MELTVLGTYGGFPARGSACMGHLVSGRNARVLVDCGSGSASRLQEFASVDQLDAIVLSHLHNDHISDVGVLRYAIELGMKHSGWRPVPVYCPLTPVGALVPLDSRAFEFHFVHDGDAIAIGDLRLSFHRTDHNIETYAVAIENAGRRLVYTADAPYRDDLADFASRADLLLAEASLLIAQKGNNPYHMTTAEAVQLGNRAGAGRLLLTHFWYESAPQTYLAEALGAGPACPVAIAEEGKTYTV